MNTKPFHVAKWVWSTIGRQLLIVLIVVLPTLSAAATTVVNVVSPAGFEDVEGNSVISPYQKPYPSRPAPPNVSGYRAHHLFLSSLFEPLGPGPFLINALAARPDISVNDPLSITWQQTWNLTTTPRNSLSTTFANNFGTEPIEQVYSGHLTFETDGVPRGGLPHDFDYLVEFDTPYLYDPQRGNLLAEFTSSTFFDGTNWIWGNWQRTGVNGQFVQAGGEDARTAFNLPGQYAWQLEVVTGLFAPGDYNGNGAVEQADLDLALLNWGAPAEPVPDGWINDLPTAEFVNQDDLDRVLLNWGSGIPGDEGAMAVPEPGAAWMILLAMGTLCLPRHVLR